VGRPEYLLAAAQHTAALISIWLARKAVGWQALAAAGLLALFFFPPAHEVILLGQVSLLLMALIAASLALLHHGNAWRDGLAGILILWGMLAAGLVGHTLCIFKNRFNLTLRSIGLGFIDGFSVFTKIRIHVFHPAFTRIA